MNQDLSGHGHTVALPPGGGTTLEAPCRKLISRLLHESLVLTEDWDALPPRAQRQVVESPDELKALARLVKHGLLTKYQAARVAAGTSFGLILGSYRLLERLGVGGMAVVFKAEHLDLRHHVAVKVLPATTQEGSTLESRFFTEMRIVARLRHPNIVAATDAGRTASDDGHTVLRYLVMEYVPGEDLEGVVRKTEPMTPARACAIAHQVAGALRETHKFGLVHRDVKPSNIMLTGEDQAKLLDFGLTRHFDHRMTVPGTVLGTIDYMAPEQARDSSTVDIRADIFGLGGTLYWCLTGRLPFPFEGSPIEALARRLTSAPPSLRTVNPDLPPELDAVVTRMMALRPEDRYADPGAVMQALLPFVRPAAVDYQELTALSFADRVPEQQPVPGVIQTPDPGSRAGDTRLPVVDGEGSAREPGRQPLRAEGSAHAELERDLAAHAGDAEAVRNALVLAVARIIEQREGRGTGHPVRMQRYCRTLAEAAAARPALADRVDCAFIDLLECCAPLHDVGRVGLPDHILMKVGQLTPEERRVMETHTTLGAEALKEVTHATGAGQDFLVMAAEVVRYHHERHDGTGYPDRLAGDAIPLAARFVAVADAYDALRCRRLYKPPLPHPAAVQILTQNSPGQFDPDVLEVFKQVAGKFEAIFKDVPE